MRAGWRWGIRVATIAASASAVAVAGLLAAAHTAWGREQLRQGIAAALGDAFPGGARVGALDGSVLGTLTLRDIELDGGDHRPLVTARTLQVSLSLWPLAGKTVRLDRAVAADVHVIVPDQAAPGSASAAPGPAPAAPGAPSPWRFELPAIEIHRGELAIAPAGIALSGVELSGAVTVAAGRVAIAGVAHGRWARGAAGDLTANGSVVIDGGVRIPGAVVTLDGAAIAATALAIDLDHPSGSITAAAPAAAIARHLPGLAPDLPGDVLATLTLSPDGAATRLALHAASGGSGLWAAVRGEPARRAGRGLVLATGIDLAAPTRGSLAGHGDVIAALEADPGGVRGLVVAHGALDVPGLPVHRAGVAILGGLGVGPAGGANRAIALALGQGDRGLEVAAVVSARARAAVSGAGSGVANGIANGIAIDEARVRASAQGVTLPCPDRAGSAAGPGGARACRGVTGALTATARLTGTIAPRLALSVDGVAEGSGIASDPEPGGAGRIAIGQLRAPFVARIASGPGPGSDPEITLTGDARARALAYDDLRVAAARGAFALALAAEPRIDRARVIATGIRRAGSRLGDARVELERRGAGAYAVAAQVQPPVEGLAIAADARVQRTGAGYRALLGRTQVTLPDASRWSGTGGLLAVPDAGDAPVRLSELVLRRGDAAIALSGSYDRRAGALVGHARADRVDAAALHAAARGTGHGTLELALRGGSWQADATAFVSGLAVSPGAMPVDASAHVVLAPRRVTAAARASGAALGSLEIALDAGAPRDPFDLAAWRRLDRDAFQVASVTARGVALSGLAGLLGAAGAVPAGTIDGALDLAPAALRGGFAVRGVALPLGTLEGDVALAPRDGDLGGHATARLVGVAAAELTARLAVPAHPLDPATWQRHGRDLVREVQAELGDLAFDPARLERLGIAGWLARHGIAAPYRGHASARLAVGAAAGEAQLAIEVTGVTGGRLIAPISHQLAIGAGPSGSHLRAELRAGGPGGELGLGVLEGDIPTTLEGWVDDPAAALRAPLTARWTLPATPLVPALAVLGNRALVSGTLEGSAAIRGTVAAPVVPSLRLVARDVRAAPRLGGQAAPAIRELTAAASWDGASGTLAIDGAETTGGELHAQASGRPDALAAASAAARATRLDLAPIAAFLPGALASAAGIVDGELARAPGGRVTGALHVTRGALPLAPEIGTLRDATAELASDGRTITAVLDGRLGRGTIHLDARAAADDLATARARLQLRGVSPIAALRPVITADVEAELHRAPGQLRGTVTVERGSITLPEHAGTPLLDASVPSDLVLAGALPAGPSGPRAPAHPWLVLDVALGATRVDAPELAEGLAFLGTMRSDRLEVSIGDALGVRGRVDIDSADVDLLGRRYVVEPSELEFDGTTDARLGIRMSHEFPELVLNVAVLGRVSQPDLRFSSDVTSYTNDELFGFFLGGDPAAEPTSQTRGAVAGAGTRLLSGRLGRQISKVLPVKIDALACEPDPASTTAAIGSCTVGKWVSERLFLAYRQRLQPRSGENAGDVRLQLRMGNRILIEGSGGDRNIYGADLLWRHRW